MPDEPIAPTATATLDLLRYERDAATSSTTHGRTKRGKVTSVQPRAAVVRRADMGLEVRAVRLAVAQMTRGEFVCWIALRDGVFCHHRKGAKRAVGGGTWEPVRPPHTTATEEAVCVRYGLAPKTVRDYDRTARALVETYRVALGLTGTPPDFPVWATLLSDELLTRLILNPTGPTARIVAAARHRPR